MIPKQPTDEEKLIAKLEKKLWDAYAEIDKLKNINIQLGIALIILVLFLAYAWSGS